MNDRIKEMVPKPWTFPFPDRELYKAKAVVGFDCEMDRLVKEYR